MKLLQLSIFRKLLSVFIVLSFIFITTHPFVQAQVTSPAVSSTSTTLIPPSFELFADPGETLTEKIEVRNEGSNPLIYNVGKKNFEAVGDSGIVQLVSGNQGNTYSLSQWITPSVNSLNIAPHQSQDLTFTINVPQNAEPGGHYGAVSVESIPSNIPGAANIGTTQVSLILLRVSGNVTEKASVQSFSSPSYLEYGPVTLRLIIANTGNVHIAPTGTIVITDTFGNKVEEIPLTSRNVLPGASRIMDTVWNQTNLIGRFKATLVANYGESHQTLVAQVYFSVFPKSLILITGISIVILVLLVGFIIAGRRRILKAIKVITQG